MAAGKIMSRGTKKQVDATLPGGGKQSEGGMLSEGEGFPPGSRHSAILNERPNKSLNRNNGDDMTRPSANPSMVPVVTQSVRKTGRI